MTLSSPASIPTLRYSSIERSAIVLVLIVVGALIIIVGFSLPTHQDEFQYLAAAHLHSKLTIYGDFFYSQTPYFPISLNAWLTFLGPYVESPYLLGRAFNTLWSLVLLICLAYILLSITPKVVLALALLVAVFTSSLLDLALRVTRNDVMPLALTVGALAMIVSSFSAPNRLGLMIFHFMAGLLVSLAVGTKLSYAFVALAFVVYSLTAVHISARERIKCVTLPLAVGGAVGAAPMLITIIPHWDNFRYSAITFHNETHALWLILVGSDVGLQSTPKRLMSFLLEPSSLCLWFIGTAILFLSTLVAKLRVLPGSRSSSISLLILAFTAVVAILCSCLLARPVQRFYVAPILPFLALGVAALANLAEGRRESDDHSRSTFAAVAAVLLVPMVGFGVFSDKLGALAHVGSVARAYVKGMFRDPVPSGWVHMNRVIGEEKWAIDHVARVRAQLQAILGPPNENVKIATLMSTYVIDAGFEIYPEFAGAPFFYRVNDHVDQVMLYKLRGTSPSRVETWLSLNDVKVLLVGYSTVGSRPDLETGFKNYALREGFSCFKINLRGAYGTNEGFLFTAKELARRSADC